MARIDETVVPWLWLWVVPLCMAIALACGIFSPLEGNGGGKSGMPTPGLMPSLPGDFRTGR
jgi:hypothetical protein